MLGFWAIVILVQVSGKNMIIGYLDNGQLGKYARLCTGDSASSRGAIKSTGTYSEIHGKQ